MSVLPPSLIDTIMFVAPASIEFSTNSFITEINSQLPFKGRFMTSPAAIRFITSYGSFRIILTRETL